ncbi:hypothetical protein BV372_04065 [Nostoc sp. T09]|uniref:hypothetical protein n=1 Tax=Nostoc sp. T09 TaxID=1932621 RepID=UPI000A370F03|nr:hypothetical protein [Nostoc sp. T09]OUL37074.1 hypothetical protein BV372_04065 [Nostoc sp. T09]
MLNFYTSLNQYLAATLASVIGAALLISVGIFLSSIFENATGKHGLEHLFFRAAGMFGGWWVGAIGGCWLMLWKRPLSNAVLTTTLLAVLTPLGMWWFMYFIKRTDLSIDKLGFWSLIGLIIVVLSLLAQLLTNMLLSL